MARKHVLVLGATGRFGRHACDAFWNAGWAVSRFDRRSDRLPDAAQGMDVIVNGWNPPYTEWESQLRGQAESVIAAAEASGASILIPGNVYVYGVGSSETLTPETPHRAANRLGRLRVEVEAMYKASSAQVILLRAGDFIDTVPSGNWLDRVIAKNAAKGKLSYPGIATIPHAWAYLPDMAAAAVALVEKREILDDFEEVLFPGYTLTGQELARTVSSALGKPVAVKPMSWLPLRLAKPFWPMAKHLIEMSYLWTMPHRIDDSQLSRLLPEFVPTPVDQAMTSALKHQIDPNQSVAGSGIAIGAD